MNTFKMLMLTGTLMLSTAAHAHRVWVETGHTHGGEILKAELGYGEFPDMEPIAADRLNIFKPLQLVTAEGKQDLQQKGEHNYQYQSKRPVRDGSYLVIAEYLPTFWSKNAAGWKRVDMKAMPDATYCEQTRMYGKNIVNVGHESADTAIITKPVGHKLEIVPLDNPANIHVGERFKVKVLFNGEPLPNATLTATFDGFDTSDRSKTHKVEAQAFSDKTGADGTVDIIPLRQGFWKANVEHSTAYSDPAVCQKQANYSTLTFEIGHAHH
ncbi:TPA: DUF4198 domain-containing protein [Neisseria weaveri]|uniref:ABC transporter substrate-binding protein n=2 Tax=Neisseria weaveri TaxID=28091 RepID=A0A3S5F9H6_9NEIS|nr:DUF4198 domain-containing protein [Neisseria weaveri]EGV35214.1 hypothetical protein l13_16320 [Neisseria weaveri ATCC 51223]EGV36932.1 hypothetical protein l11_15080 [Neisseria weaveri LMG 5135]SAY51060.1 ABC transporter substrate-binding protein [Neisseria weaveri]VEJ49579.1 ABC transporter substrate-binding protein [Neisseria weaveri]